MNAQVKKDGKGKGGAAAALVAGVVVAAAALVAPWEGLRNDPYRDIVGKLTVCYGDTTVPMRRYSTAECRDMLGDRLTEYLEGVGECVHQPITTNQAAAVLSWTYNVGIGAACGSTLVRKLNAGSPASEWCRELLRWDYAGGKRVRGLTNRRQAEYEVCVS